jgi:TatA/E family protein of Tat protein translocase
MEFLGIGPLELILILVLALVIFGPKDIEKAGKSIGKSLNKFVRSDTWRTINQTSQELRNLPNRLMRESGLDEIQKSTREELSQAGNTIHQSLSVNPAEDSPTPFKQTPPPSTEAKNENPPEEVETEKQA